MSLQATLSFEYFPPKDAEGEHRFWEAAHTLDRFSPDWISITCGAGGSQRNRTAALALALKESFVSPVVAHMTTVGESRESLAQGLDTYRQHGVRHLLALRGDRPREMGEEEHLRTAFAHASDFVAFARERFPECRIGVACYPEKHPESADMESELRHFRLKAEAGADFAVTQFFFDNDAYFRFVEEAGKRGAHLPIIPGIMPVTDFRQIRRFSELCGSVLPPWLIQRMESLREDGAGMLAAGVEIALRQCEALLEGGAPGLHLFTLNRARAVGEVLTGLGLPPRA